MLLFLDISIFISSIWSVLGRVLFLQYREAFDSSLSIEIFCSFELVALNIVSTFVPPSFDGFLCSYHREGKTVTQGH